MSFQAEVYAVRLNGDVTLQATIIQDTGCKLISEYLAKKYQTHEHHTMVLFNPKPVWDLFQREEVSLDDKLLLGITFDGVIVKKETIPRLVQAMMGFLGQYALLPVYSMVAVLRHMVQDPEITGVCFRHTTSAPTDLWADSPYNIFTRHDHWFLDDDLKDSLAHDAAICTDMEETQPEPPQETVVLPLELEDQVQRFTRYAQRHLNSKGIYPLPGMLFNNGQTVAMMASDTGSGQAIQRACDLARKGNPWDALMVGVDMSCFINQGTTLDNALIIVLALPGQHTYIGVMEYTWNGGQPFVKDVDWNNSHWRKFMEGSPLMAPVRALSA